MHDDEIDEMLQTLKGAGVSDVQVRRILEVLGAAEEIGVEIAATLPPSKKGRVEEAVTAALCRMLKGG